MVQLRRFAVLAIFALGCESVVASSVSGTSSGSGGTPGSSSATTTAASGVGGAGGQDAGSFPTVDAFCAAYGHWYCGVAVACGCTNTSGWPGSTSACETGVRLVRDFFEPPHAGCAGSG